MSLELRRTDAKDPAFRALVQQLDADLDDRYGDQQDFYGQFNALDAIKQVVVAYQGEAAVACGAIKAFDEQSMEVKRMYVQKAARGKGIATTLLLELEDWAKTLGYTSCVLQLADNQAEALALYLKNGYARTANFGQYIGDENSICMRKDLK
ncbi:MAG: GNAT family N-acetyltransferase [Saprospiraceae bacterium]|nr:GNAT family N-acetyltransferase [Saprospiraceae bacterium]